jgi:uncharacterized protein YqeY
MILNDLQADLNSSLKAGNAVRVLTLRSLISAVRNAAIDKYGAKGESSLTDADVVDVVNKQVKTHKESIEAFRKAGRSELVAKEQGELVVLEEFAPKEISDEELKKILAPVVSSGEQNFGLLMKQAMGIVKGLPAQAGQADGGRVSALLRQMMVK